MISPAAVISDWAWLASSPLELGEVWYLGSRYEDLLALQDKAGVVHSGGGRLNAIFDRLRDDFVNLDGHLASGRCEVLWDCSDLAERNPFTSDFQATCCRAVAMLEILKGHPSAQIVVDSSELAEAMAGVARLAGFAVTLTASRRRGWLGIGRSLVLRRLAQGFRWLRAIVQMKAARGGASVRWDELRRAGTLLISWCMSKSFGGASGVEPDSYFGAYPALLKRDGQSLGWLGNSTDWARSVEEMAKLASSAADPVMMVQDLWRPWDVLCALTASLAFPLAVKRRLVIAGHDLSPLLRRAIIEEVCSVRLSFALLYGRSIRRLAEKGVRPAVLIHPYERQPWEMALRKAARRWLPETRQVGFMHAPVAPRYVSFIPSRRELARGLVPDRLLVIGEHFRQDFAAAGLPIETITVVGAFRFAGAFGDCQPAGRPTAPRVLCPCPIEFDEALELVRKTALALRDLPGVSLLVNFHPAADSRFRQSLERQMENLLPKERVEFSGKPASSLLPQVSCVVYNASGVVFEAARMGLPSIFIGSEVALDLDKLPGGQEPPRSAEELRAVLMDCLDHPERATAIAADNAQRAASVFCPPVEKHPLPF